MRTSPYLTRSYPYRLIFKISVFPTKQHIGSRQKNRALFRKSHILLVVNILCCLLIFTSFKSEYSPGHFSFSIASRFAGSKMRT